MASKSTRELTGERPQRKCQSWIESFVEWGKTYETPEIYLRWAAITTVAAALEQRVFVLTRAQLFPNLYTILIGPPGVGKSNAIRAVAGIVRSLDGLFIGPVSVTGASLIDAMANAKRVVDPLRIGDKPLLFNSLYIMPDDLQALLHKYDTELVANLTIFYDNIPYIQTRRTSDLKIEITSPQLSILAGTTTSHLMNLLPPGAWEQGFMSRVIMIHSKEKPIHDDLFDQTPKTRPEDLAHDLKAIFTLRGQLRVSDEFKQSLNDWRKAGMVPAPNHPRLTNYCARRVVQLLKLSIVACADRGEDLCLELRDFEQAKKWLFEAELSMPAVFGGATTVDAMAINEILHLMGPDEVFQMKLTRLVTERVNVTLVKRVIELMIESGMIYVSRIERGKPFYKVSPGSSPDHVAGP